MSTKAVAIVNASTVVSDADLAKYVAAAEIQVNRDFVPHWGRDASLAMIGRGVKPPANTWMLAVLDSSDQAGALGYHDTTPTGDPLGKVFAETDLDYGALVSVTLTHELLEMLADPWIAYTAQDGDLMYALEVGDPVEADADGYDINGVQVTNFVTPAWFGPFLPGKRYDFRGLLTKPHTLRPGGYISVLRLGHGAGWTQMNADRVPARKARPHVGSRRERRRIGREQWIPSTIEVA